MRSGTFVYFSGYQQKNAWIFWKIVFFVEHYSLIIEKYYSEKYHAKMFANRLKQNRPLSHFCYLRNNQQNWDWRKIFFNMLIKKYCSEKYHAKIFINIVSYLNWNQTMSDFNIWGIINKNLTEKKLFWFSQEKYN